MQYFVMWLILHIDSVATLTFGIPERAMSLTLWCCAPWMLATSTSHRPPWATWRRREDKLWWAQPIWCDVVRGTGPTSWWDYIDWDHSPLNPSGYRTGFREKPTVDVFQQRSVYGISTLNRIGSPRQCGPICLFWWRFRWTSVTSLL